MNNILIVGASGYIGSRLSYSLAKDGNNVTALCYPNIPKDKKWCSLMKEVILGDITSENVIKKITTQSYDVAIYLVSLDHHDSNKSPEFVNSINVLPVWNLLESFKTKKTLKRFIYFSTIHVYGNIESKIVEEAHNTFPNNPYGLTHLMCENICNMYNSSSDIDCINIRLSNSYGSPFFQNNNCWKLVVNEFCLAAFTKKRIELKSDGSALRDFIHYTDIFNAIKLIINYQNSKMDNIFNLSYGKTISILNVLEKVKSIYKIRYGFNITSVMPNYKESTIKNNLETYTISNDKIKLIGFNQEIDLETGINELFDYLEYNEN
tara:strand:+ start:3084 stop:4046 length:963 start_codon:yes stop_codon:yes gene_type:complete